MAFDPLPIETDLTVLTDAVLDALAAALPGWQPVEGDPLVAIAEETAAESATWRTLLQQAAGLAVATFASSAVGLAPLPGAPALLPVLLTCTASGAAVPDGFTVTGTTADGVDVAFVLPGIAVAGADGTVLVQLQALSNGGYGNGVPAGPLTITTVTTTVLEATATAPSAGGRDDEALQPYLDRVTDRFAILRPGGVLAADLAVLARDVPGVHRALGIDNYDADTDIDGVARTATVVPIDADGLPVVEAVAEQVRALLESVREVNFNVRIGAPTYTRVQVQFEAVAETGADPIEVQAAVRAAGLAFLDPARWAEGDDPDRPVWQPQNTVRFLQLSRVMGSAPGVAYLSSLTLNGGTADLVLAGRAPLPTPATGDLPTTVTGTVT